jgi:hypothetical protein
MMEGMGEGVSNSQPNRGGLMARLAVSAEKPFFTPLLPAELSLVEENPTDTLPRHRQ